MLFHYNATGSDSPTSVTIPRLGHQKIWALWTTVEYFYGENAVIVRQRLAHFSSDDSNH